MSNKRYSAGLSIFSIVRRAWWLTWALRDREKRGLRRALGVGLQGPVNTPCGHRVAAPDAGPARREAGG